MALTDDVQDRIPSQRLVELTNPRDATATSINTTKLAQAATSIEARFSTYAQQPYDGAVDMHVELCVEGVVSLLGIWGSTPYEGAKEFWESFKSECEMYAGVSSRARLEPVNDSDLTPSDEKPDGMDEMRPWADDTAFEGLVVDRRGDTDYRED